MSKTIAAIIVGATSNIVRRIVVPYYDDSEILGHPLAAGEKELLVPIETINPMDPMSVARAVSSATGMPAASGRCAVVVSGRVVDIIVADPLIDSIPGATLILHPTAIVGDWHG